MRKWTFYLHGGDRPGDAPIIRLDPFCFPSTRSHISICMSNMETIWYKKNHEKKINLIFKGSWSFKSRGTKISGHEDLITEQTYYVQQVKNITTSFSNNYEPQCETGGLIAPTVINISGKSYLVRSASRFKQFSKSQI